jgi:hypothetical protein
MIKFNDHGMGGSCDIGNIINAYKNSGWRTRKEETAQRGLVVGEKIVLKFILNRV